MARRSWTSRWSTDELLVVDVLLLVDVLLVVDLLLVLGRRRRRRRRGGRGATISQSCRNAGGHTQRYVPDSVARTGCRR